MSEIENDVLDKIRQLYTQKGWSVYRLAKESHIAYSSLNNMFLRNTQPTIFTLEKLCKGLGISLSDFFNDKKTALDYKYCLQLEQSEYALIEAYRNLSPQEKQLLLAYLQGLSKKPL